MRRSLRIVTLLAVPVFVLAACSATRRVEPAPSSSTTVAKEPPATLLAVGDIADCKSDNDTRTAALAETRPGPIALLGDLAYENGTTKEFAQCYGPAWGTLDARARPVPGNHEYNVKQAKGYYAYFGDRAGDPTQGWYSYDVGRWHVVALNSNCGSIGGCDASSAQAAWLRKDLADHPATCTLAYFHHPRWSSGLHGANEFMDPIWQILSDAKADVVLSGHDHDYERFAPKDRAGENQTNGLRQFVVGTGGKSLYPSLIRRTGSEVFTSSTYGILELDLHPDSYAWRFVPTEEGAFRDEGRASCDT